ncbi:MAG: DNA mismatch repair endonuclease MutL [Prevotellaceae bacterium]|jgi:DNA mismatch repair protein MutL|nr:DNA mismatch repair endonuclease MutL [Prevotellaceae bacterium]
MIQLLPDHIANQIAAGEVVQRPASALKELLENAIDAGATSLTVILADAGRTLLQVVDNGCGMSSADARMAFERHATSKIRQMDDLNAITTFGFRGEALASIAAVSEVVLKTRREKDELGTQVVISASEVTAQEPVACNAGTSIAVRNLFFNVPARRKFLKSDNVELRNLVIEMQRVALCHPEVAFTMQHNGATLYNLPSSNLRQRIVALMGKDINQRLITVQVDTSVVRISGFIGKPESAKRTASEQFFFVNNRFFKSPYFQKAFTNAYQQLLPERLYPAFFIFFDLPPDKIDVNIHPAKIEVKFEEEQIIFQMLYAAVREALGKFAVVPSIDFNMEGAPAIPAMRKGAPVTLPSLHIDPSFNPFDEKGKQKSTPGAFSGSVLSGWEKLYEGLPPSKQFEDIPEEKMPEQLSVERFAPEPAPCLVKGKYILTPVKSGWMIIDRRRARQRILYERFLQNLWRNLEETQQEIFPQTVTLPPADYVLLESVLEDLAHTGYDIRPFGNNTVVVNGQPASFPPMDAAQLLEELLHALHENTADLKTQRQEKLARSLSKAAAGTAAEPLNMPEAQALVDNLFACKEPSLSPEGKPTLQIITVEEIDKRFLK